MHASASASGVPASASASASGTMIDTLRLGKPLRDVKAAPHPDDGVPDCAAQLDERDARLYSFLGPSRACANHHLLHPAVVATAPWRQRPRGRGWLAWVVDTPVELAPLVSRGVDQVISNYPLRISEAVEAARRAHKCTAH